ncbi:MAG TPA: FHA domain-containing protein [Polyangiaceae bacterium]
MTSNDQRASGAPGDEGTSRTITKFWIEYRGHKIELRVGTTVIGRSAACQVVLDDGLVSRRHAQITADKRAAVLEDFGSVNGVFVNNLRVAGSRTLRDGDVVRMGKQEFSIRSVVIDLGEASQFGAETLHGGVTMSRGNPIRQTAERVPSGPTHPEGFAVLGNVADKVLALGRGAEAERVLSGAMQALLVASRGTAVLPIEVADKAAEYAVRLVVATRKSSWADYAFELFMNLRRPLPGAVVDELYSVLRTVSGVDLTLLRNYVALLQALQHSFGPSERFLVQRIEGLERIVTR